MLAKGAERLDQAAGLASWQLTGPDVQSTLALIGLVRHRLERLETVVAAEAIGRKLPGERGMSDVDYLIAAEGLSVAGPYPAHAARLTRLAKAHTACATAGGAGAAVLETGQPDVIHSSQELAGDVMGRFHAGQLGSTKTDMLMKFHTQAEPLSDAQSFSEVMRILTLSASDDHLPEGQYGPMGEPAERVSGLREKDLRTAIQRTLRLIKPAPDLAEDEERLRNSRSLHALPWENGCTEYRLVLDPEGSAILDSAISALSAPKPHSDSDPDTRTAARRRADALLTVIQRGISAPGKVPKTEKAQVLITIGYSELREQIRGSGTSLDGQVLSPQTVRKIACDAAIIPAVLGSEGEILDKGRAERLFTPGQRKALWHRDKHCSFPDCTMPPSWCDAHHVVHWTDDGPTSLDNGALLCPRHHTYVHDRGLTATVGTTGVTWHL